MNDAARRLRAQKAFSTDPDYLERLARAEEARDHAAPLDGAVRDRVELSGKGQAREFRLGS
ncbi:MAG TPA: hypothetical protein VLA02_15155 [Reyranella sp.]|nr:hypothetical protein [Reyranella sp.]